MRRSNYVIVTQIKFSFPLSLKGLIFVSQCGSFPFHNLMLKGNGQRVLHQSKSKDTVQKRLKVIYLWFVMGPVSAVYVEEITFMSSPLVITSRVSQIHTLQAAGSESSMHIHCWIHGTRERVIFLIFQARVADSFVESSQRLHCSRFSSSDKNFARSTKIASDCRKITFCPTPWNLFFNLCQFSTMLLLLFEAQISGSEMLSSSLQTLDLLRSVFLNLGSAAKVLGWLTGNSFKQWGRGLITILSRVLNALMYKMYNLAQFSDTKALWKLILMEKKHPFLWYSIFGKKCVLNTRRYGAHDNKFKISFAHASIIIHLISDLPQEGGVNKNLNPEGCALLLKFGRLVITEKESADSVFSRIKFGLERMRSTPGLQTSFVTQNLLFTSLQRKSKSTSYFSIGWFLSRTDTAGDVILTETDNATVTVG